jgi:hypothetical protein
MFNRIKDISNELSDRTKRTKESFESAWKESSNALCVGKEKSKQSIDKHWPAIEKLVVERLAGIKEEKLRDKAFLESTFDKVYELLPTAIRLVVKRDKFIGYCMGQQEHIVRRIEVYKSERENKAGLLNGEQNPHA